MTDPLRLGVIGFGGLVRRIHLDALSRLPGVGVVAIAEADASRRAEARVRSPAAAVHAGYDELLARPDVDAVLVCLPPPEQAAAAIAVLESGRHVYVEKPLATDLDDAARVLDAWRRAGTVGMTGLNYRLHPHYRRAREVIRAGTLGDLVGARSIFSAPAAFPQPRWKMSLDSGGGVLLDLGSHHADLVHFLFEAPVREVYAEARSVHGEADTAVLELRLAGGLLVQSFFSLSAVDEERFDVYGQAGKLTVDRCAALDVTVREPTRERYRLRQAARGLRALRHASFLVTRSRAVGCEPSYSVALGCFADAVRTGRSARPDLEDGYRSLAVVKAAEESIGGRASVAVAVPA